MDDKLSTITAFLIDAERLKLVERKAYVSDHSRRESSAEHSWHLALGLLTLARELDLDIDLPKALTMAIIHDVCEIDAGDTPAYGPVRAGQHEAERECVERLAGYGLNFGAELRALWLEYEAQETRESRWIKVLDRVDDVFIAFRALFGRPAELRSAATLRRHTRLRAGGSSLLSPLDVHRAANRFKRHIYLRVDGIP